MTHKRFGFMIGTLLGSFVVILIAKPAQAGCQINCWSRTCAKSYGYTAVYEPYRVTHAEWINDDQKTSEYEGVDCSGLVYKTWAMENTDGSINFYRWSTEEILSEKYNAGGFYNNCSSTNACTTVCYGGNCPTPSTEIMDAFATLNDPANSSDDHVGLIYAEINDTRDYILEAVQQSGDQDVRIIEQDWRGDPKYRGIRRANWSFSCPTCPVCAVYLPNIYSSSGVLVNGINDSNPYPTSKLEGPIPNLYP